MIQIKINKMDLKPMKIKTKSNLGQNEMSTIINLNKMSLNGFYWMIQALGK